MSAPRSLAIGPRALRAYCVFVLGIGFSLTVIGQEDIASDASTANPHDCGFIALATLLRLEGCEADFAQLEARLPPPKATGYSMKELRDAGRALGLPLIGVRLKHGPRSLDRPAIVHLDQGTHGHFVVLRPLGHTGRLVQMLDVNGPPLILEVEELENAPAWTGYALIVDRRFWARRVAGAGGLAALGAIAWVAVARTRWRAPGSRGRDPNHSESKSLSFRLTAE